MLISIIIGALNEENYIGKALRTAKAQKTNHEFEVILGDGYSEDKTVEIAKKLGVKVVMEKRRSAAWQRQAAAKVAKGEIIVFTDADADIPDNWVQKIGDEFEKDKDLVMLYGPVYLYGEESLARSISNYLMDFYLFSLSLVGMHNPIGSNIAVKRKVFEEIGGFNTDLITAEDLDLAKRIKGKGKLKFVRSFSLYVSDRRVKQWGYIKYSIFHIKNGLRYHFTGKGAKKYSVVR